ncbi:MAG: ATP-binding protein [Bacteroidales bacterium]|nr:ATP-binding protein [Bacteroidales bacterium]
MEIRRDKYLQQLIGSRHNQLIKVVTGIRRCGKSYLLFELFYKYLKENGVEESHIIRIDLEDRRNIALRDPDALLHHIDALMTDADMYYILLDEVQHVPEFEDVLNSYLHVKNADVYATGSNSKFLSSDIITEFRGRSDQIHISPLSFAEFYSAVGGAESDAWNAYARYGGLPHVVSLLSDERKSQYLSDLYESVYKRDIIERNKLAKSHEFDELVKIMASSIGAPCNPSKLSKTFKSVENTNLTYDTIARYLKFMEDAFLIHKAERYDVKGKKYINSLSKYYFSDIGLRNALLNFRQQEETHIMENIVYNELCIRGFKVDVGVVEKRVRNAEHKMERRQYEVDFVANLGSKRYYIQSALALPTREKTQQESNSLSSIHDNFQKIIIVKDAGIHWHTDDGILVLSLFDFLLRPESIDW